MSCIHIKFAASLVYGDVWQPLFYLGLFVYVTRTSRNPCLTSYLIIAAVYVYSTVYCGELHFRNVVHGMTEPGVEPGLLCSQSGVIPTGA